MIKDLVPLEVIHTHLPSVVFPLTHVVLKCVYFAPSIHAMTLAILALLLDHDLKIDEIPSLTIVSLEAPCCN